MFRVKIAELIIEINNHHLFIEEQCTGYYTNEEPQIYLYADEAEIYAEQSGPITDLGYCESIVLYRKLAMVLPKFDALLFHGSAIEYNNQGIVFTAPSGVGKTTQTLLWKSMYPTLVRIINGDKPIFRLIDKHWYAFGTPWMGKELLGENGRTPIQHICFLEQGKVDTIYLLPNNKVSRLILKQLLFPVETLLLPHYLNLIDSLIRNTSAYRLECTISDLAVITARKGMGIADA